MQARTDPSLLAPEESLPAFFERVAAGHRDRKAFGYGAWQPTYGALNAAANRLAHKLIGLECAPGDRVAVLMQHDAPLIAAMLGVLKAGNIVVVLNHTDPPARQAQVLSNADVAAVVTDEDFRESAEALAPADKVVLFEKASRDGPDEPPNVSVDPDETAFLVFTSGSTGSPKAVMQTHRQVLQKVGRLFDGIGVSTGERIALVAALSGGQGIGTAWCALANGAMLFPYAVMDRGFAGLAGWINDRGITVYLSSASLFRNLIRSLPDGTTFPSIRAVMIASEPATSDDFRTFQKHFTGGCRFAHMLSSSETGNIARLFLDHGDAVAEGTLPVGLPAPGVEIEIVDELGSPVARGESGEIVVRSRYLSAGYWRDPELTAQRFAAVADSGGIHTFRSGDRARINADGLLEFMGRNDSRLKLRGHRIDPTEIERELQALPMVERAAVGLQQRAGKEPLLVAYVVRRGGKACPPTSLRHALLTKLPRHQVPSVFAFVADLPLTAHGKIAREKLSEIPIERSTEQWSEARNNTEAILAGAWAEALDCGRVGRGDDFFELGGDSLIAAVVAAKIYSKLGVELNLGQFIDHPVLADLAGAIEKTGRADGTLATRPLGGRDASETPPLSFLQERIWATSRSPDHSARYTVARSYRLAGAIDVDRLRDCVIDVVQRHEILRTTFEERDGKPVQVVHALPVVAFKFFDVSTSEDPAEEAGKILKMEAAAVFDLQQLPLLRFTLIRLRATEYRLLRVSHGILADGWSWQVFLRDLARAYDARTQGEAPASGELPPLQFADYAVWQRSAFERGSAGYSDSLNWWRNYLWKAPPPAPLPFKRRRRAALQEASQGLVHFVLSPEVSLRLEDIARTQGATFYAVRIAVFAALLAAETGQTDVTFGAFVTRRNRLELQQMMGLFGNQVRLRFAFSEQETFRVWLSRVRQIIVDTEAHAQIPYEQLRGDLLAMGVELPGLYVFANVFQFLPAMRFDHFTVEEMDWHTEFMPSAFIVNFGQYNERSDSRIAFDASLYDPAKVRDFAGRLSNLFEAVSRDPDLPIAENLKICGAVRPGPLRRVAAALKRLRR